MIKKKCVIIVILVIVSMTFLYVLKINAFREAPLKNEMKLSELERNHIIVKYVENGERWTDEDLCSFVDEQIKGAESCSYIFTATPTDNIYFNDDTIIQEVEVRQVIKGTIKSSTVWITNGLSSTIKYDGNNVILSGMDRSFMQGDCEYLLLCSGLSANKYSDKKIYEESDSVWLGCYNITRNSEKTVDLKNAQYDKSIEYYVNSKEVLMCYNDAKEALVKKYCK